MVSFAWKASRLIVNASVHHLGQVTHARYVPFNVVRMAPSKQAVQGVHAKVAEQESLWGTNAKSAAIRSVRMEAY